MGRLGYSFEIVKAAFKVILNYPKLLIFAVFSACSSILIVGAFIIPLLFTSQGQMGSVELTTPTIHVDDEEGVIVHKADPINDKLDHASASFKNFERKAKDNPVEFYGYLFLFYFCFYLVSVFFNTAIISCVVKAFSGERPTLMAGFLNAISLLHYIVVWVLFAGTVGTILSVVQSRSNKVGELVAGIAGFVWSIATFFVVPVMAIERVGPLKAFDASFNVIKKTWGENIVGEVSFGIIFACLRFLWIVPIVLGLLLGKSMILFFFVVSLVYLFFVEMLSILVQPVFLTALYLYARDGNVPEAFEGELLQGSFRQSGFEIV